MANKYQQQSLEAQRRRYTARSCLTKVRFETEDEAQQKGQRSYYCHNCNGYHRASSIRKTLGYVRGAG